jgi:hypothetical protein
LEHSLFAFTLSHGYHLVMARIDTEILKEFQAESKHLLVKMTEILEKCEGDFSQVESLEEYGQNVDRIMGGAQSLAVDAGPNHLLHKIGDYASICKAVGYKSSQIRGNEPFYNICVALLLDGNEVMQAMLNALDVDGDKEIKNLIPGPFLERLKWVSTEFGNNVRSSVKTGGVFHKDKPRLSQVDIDSLLKKLGLD